MSKYNEIEVKVTYDARNLSRKMPKMINGLVKRYTIKTGENVRSNIFEGKVKPNLSKTTKDIRRKRGQAGSPPLLASGKLFNSIKVKKGKNTASISMFSYGALHNRGYNTAPNSMIPRKKVPKRQFITPKKGTFDKLVKDFGKDLTKHFKKKGNHVVSRGVKVIGTVSGGS